MKMKKIIDLIISVIVIFNISLSVSAADNSQALQMCFTNDGKTLKVYTSTKLDENAEALIGGDRYKADIKNNGIKINTIFLIDNSSSIPKVLRAEVKKAVMNYADSMPENENIRIAMFDNEVTTLSDEYTNDSGFIEYALSKIDFNGQYGFAYDALANVINELDSSKDEYYRTVLITGEFDTDGSVTYDYLKKALSEEIQYHVDVVETSESDKSNPNLTAIANLGSNTYTMFRTDSNLNSLNPGNVSLMKIKLSRKLTTGEMKGITIKNGSSDISVGSIMFPQVEGSGGIELTTTMFILIIAVGAVVIIGTIIVFLIVRAKRRFQCSVSVQITKDDERDKKGVGMDVWKFPVSREFKVGRTINPVSDNKKKLPRNDRAICEDATNEDISSIGRNAFSLSYDSKTNSLIIKNTANSATFTIQTAGRKDRVKSGQTLSVMNGSKILLGNYTTIIIHNFVVNKG